MANSANSDPQDPACELPPAPFVERRKSSHQLPASELRLLQAQIEELLDTNQSLHRRLRKVTAESLGLMTNLNPDVSACFSTLVNAVKIARANDVASGKGVG